MNIIKFKINSWYMCFQLNFTSLNITIVFPRWGFQFLYLYPNYNAYRFESGYRIFNKGMRGAVEGQEWSIAEEWICKSPWLEMAA